MKRILSGLLAVPALSLSLGALAAEAPVYHYGMPLDVAKVISIEQPNERCEVSLATMTYADSQGQVHAVQYLRQTEMCSNGG